MGTETDAIAPASALRRGLLRAGLVHATEPELDWLIAEAGTVEGARRQAFQRAQLSMITPLTIIALGIAAPWLDHDDHGYVQRFGIDEPNADVQVEAVGCLLDATHLLRLTATLVNNTDLDYTVTLRADVRTADNGYEGMQQVRVPARSSHTRLDEITGLAEPATRCELTVVKRERYPEALIGGSIPEGDGRGVTVTPRS